MKTACLLFLVVPARAVENFKVVTSGSCDPLASGGRYLWIETKAACEEAASALGKKQTSIPENQVDMTEYESELPYCAYYPDATVEGSNGPDALWMLSGLNTGECSKQRECLCRGAGPGPDGDSSGSVATVVVPIVVGAVVIIVVGVLTYVRTRL